ncbi:MAG: hypothetical protein JSV66_17055, partial [Trueperaceae bacterium]
LAKGQHQERLERRQRERLTREMSALQSNLWQHIVWIIGDLLISAGQNLQASRRRLSSTLHQTAGEVGCD